MNLQHTGLQLTSSALPTNYLRLYGRQAECRLQGGVLGHLACPDQALPEIAYQAFLELRMILHAPDEVIMAALLAAMSTACQSWIRVKPPHMDRAHVTTLALYTAADTGWAKSPVMDRVFMPARLIGLARLSKLEHAEKERRDQHLILHAKRRGLLARVSKLYGRGVKVDPEQLAQAEQAVKSLEDNRSSGSQFVSMVKGDISPSRLLHDLHGTRSSILVATPEGRNFFGKMTSEDMELHNLVWDGAALSYERMHRTVIAHEPLVTYCAMTHPDQLERFIRGKGKAARASGWLGRGLLSRALPYDCHPTSPILHPTFPRTDVFNARSQALLEGCEKPASDGSIEPTTLEFDPSATVVFMEMLRANNDRMSQRDDWGLVQDFGRKYPSNVARIAAIFHFFSKQPGTHISTETLISAIRIGDWYINQARQILVIEPMKQGLKKLIEFLHESYAEFRHKKEVDPDEARLVPLRWIMQFHNIRRDDLDPLLGRLVEERCIEHCYSRRGKHCICLHPDIFNRR